MHKVCVSGDVMCISPTHTHTHTSFEFTGQSQQFLRSPDKQANATTHLKIISFSKDTENKTTAAAMVLKNRQKTERESNREQENVPMALARRSRRETTKGFLIQPAVPLNAVSTASVGRLQRSEPRPSTHEDVF